MRATNKKICAMVLAAAFPVAFQWGCEEELSHQRQVEVDGDEVTTQERTVKENLEGDVIVEETETVREYEDGRVVEEETEEKTKEYPSP